MSVFSSLAPQQQRTLWFLFATGLFFWMGITLLLPTLPGYIKDMGGTTQQVGWVMGSFAIGLLLSRPWLGLLVDRRSRKLVVIIGTAVASLAPLGYVSFASILPLMATRAFHGISVAAFTTGFSALVVDISPPERRGELLGYMSLVVPVGMSIGPAVGSYLQAWIGYTPLFLVSMGMAIVALLLAFQAQDQSPRLTEHAATMSTAVNFWRLCLNPALGIPTVILLQVGIVFGTLIAFLPLYLRQIEVAFNAGLFYLVVAIASFVARLLCGQLSAHYGRGLLISISLICYGASMLILAHATTASMLMLAALMEGFGRGIVLPMMLVLVADRFVESQRGRVYALCLGGFDLGFAIAGPLLGLLASVSYPATFLLAGSLAVLALLLFFTQSNKTLSHSRRFAMGKGPDLHALKP